MLAAHWQQDMDYPWKEETAVPEGCPVDWQNLMMVLGGAVMKRKTFEGLLSVLCEAK